MAAMLALGYGWLLAFVIGLTRMPTAEAVIVPIPDEFIISAGVLTHPTFDKIGVVGEHTKDEKNGEKK